MYCRRCWYVLDGLAECRCPECGRPFDPTMPRTYRTKPRSRWWWSVVRRAPAVGLLLLLTAGAWYYWEYAAQQRFLANLKSVGFGVQGKPLGPKWFTKWAKDNDFPLLLTIDWAATPARTGNDDLKVFSQMPDLEWVALFGQDVSDASVVHLRTLTKLRGLDLTSSKVTDQGLGLLTHLTRLEHLDLRATKVTDESIVFLKQFANLRMLDLRGAQMTAEGIATLKQLRPNAKVDGP